MTAEPRCVESRAILALLDFASARGWESFPDCTYERQQTMRRYHQAIVDEDMPQWRSVANDPPPEDVVVQVQNNGGAHLIRDGSLWFFPDRSMYVYYTPTLWREVP